jgi:RNA polymerase sigma-70 factor (ECF subfamily)
MESMRTLPASEDRWTEYLTAARAGCPDALGRLLEHYRPILLSLCVGVLAPDLRGKADESDLVQDSLLEAQKDFPTFRGERPEELLAWLKRILSHNLANFRRHYLDAQGRNVRREVPLPAVGSDVLPGAHIASDSAYPDEKVARQEELQRLQSAIDELPEPVREVVMLRQRDGLSFEEIGTRLGRTPDGARQVWWRAIQQLRTRLAVRD